MESIITIYFFSKDNTKENPPAIIDLLNKKNNEPLILELMKNAHVAKNIIPLPTQSNGEADYIDAGTQIQYEVKTIWGQKGCEAFRKYSKSNNNQDLEQAIKGMFMYNKSFGFSSGLFDLSFIENENKFEPEIKKLIVKMKKKKTCDYVLFYPLTTSPHIKESWMQIVPSLDALQWHNILKKNAFDFNVYIIQPTFLNYFVMEKISKNKIEQPHYFYYTEYYTKYVLMGCGTPNKYKKLVKEIEKNKTPNNISPT